MRLYVQQPCLCCTLSLRAGNVIVSAISIFIYLGVSSVFLETTDFMSETYSVSPMIVKGIISFCVIGLVLSILFLAGIFAENVYLCIPWAAYCGFTVMLDFVCLIYTSTYGLPLTDTDSTHGKIWTYFALYLLFVLHLYIFWVVAIYVKNLVSGSDDNYERFSHCNSPTSSRGYGGRSGGERQGKPGSRSPIFRIRSSDE